MEKSKLYFKTTDSINCECIEGIIQDAKEQGLNEITVLEADIDNDTSDYIWCTVYDFVEKSECKKSLCSSYKSKSGRGKCENKGQLYLHGKEVTFKF